MTLDVLHAYAWASGEHDPAEELAFMAGQYGDPAIVDWLVVLPQLKASTVPWTWPVGGLEAAVHQRTYYRSERSITTIRDRVAVTWMRSPREQPSGHD